MEAWESCSTVLRVYPADDPGRFDVVCPDAVLLADLRLDEVRGLAKERGWVIVEA